jgi:hypothetical protein
VVGGKRPPRARLRDRATPERSVHLWWATRRHRRRIPEDMLDGTNRLAAARCQSTAAPRQQGTATLVLAEHAYRGGLFRGHRALQPLATHGLNLRHGAWPALLRRADMALRRPSRGTICLRNLYHTPIQTHSSQPMISRSGLVKLVAVVAKVRPQAVEGKGSRGRSPPPLPPLSHIALLPRLALTVGERCSV